MLLVAGVLVVLMCAAPAPDDGAKAIRQAKSAMAKRDLSKARRELGPALRAEDPLTRASALQVAADIELKNRKPDRALEHLKDALSALDEADASPRTTGRLLARMQRTAKEHKRTDVLELTSAVTDADAALRSIRRWPLLPARVAPDAAALEPLRAALQDAKLMHRLMELEAGLAIAQAVEGKPSALDHLRSASRRCRGADLFVQRCRLHALRTGAAVKVLLHRADAANQRLLGDALKEAAEADLMDPSVQKHPHPYRRSDATVALCSAVDAQAGAGTCRALELKNGVKTTLPDFSRGARVGVLSDAHVRRSQQEYGFLLNRCLYDALQRDDVLRDVRFELVWAVQPTGKPSDIVVEPRRYRDHPGARCLVKMVELFRYPRYRAGERRVVNIALQTGQ